MKLVVKAVASGLGAGYAPVASGTFGTLVGILVYLLMPVACPFLYVVLTAALFLLGTWAAGEAERLYGPPGIISKDDGRIVIDEVVGYLATMAFLPYSIGWIVAGFFMFRACDILKLPFGPRTERVFGGLGVMLDDLVAGVFGCLLLHLARWIW